MIAPAYLVSALVLNFALLTAGIVLVLVDGAADWARWFLLAFSLGAISWQHANPTWPAIVGVVKAFISVVISFFFSLGLRLYYYFDTDSGWRATFALILGVLGLIGARAYWKTLLGWVIGSTALIYLLDFSTEPDHLSDEVGLWRFCVVLYAFGLLQILKSYLELRRGERI
jgi:hypothetical protein